ncbi:ABC transporter permease [Microvirga brassicacearum]|uniref:Iron ABC transporter permease n=1 Tax=Microvirga brassicacearum TaxID=2580413 RepID=A0A5N3PGL6_9HYPH|nr:iron ABC transporter permease [Microvirga brassicacearum]KAB0268877.1 iron ABC transporter permease [Microvirga brassicacearum]
MSDQTIGLSDVVIGKPASRRTGNTLLKCAYGATFIIVVAMVTIPIAALIYGSFRTAAPGMPAEWTLRNYEGLASPGVIATIGTTLWIGLLSSALCIVIGTAIALLVHRTDFKYGKVVTMLVGLAFYFPSFILAMAWIIIGAPGGIFNAVVDDMLGLSWLRIDIYTTMGIVLVMVLHQVPFVYLTMRGPIMGMDGIYEEAARTAGATPSRVITRITLPLLSYSLISSFILTFIITIEQFAIPALIGIPGQVNMLATQLYLLVRFSPTDYGLAAAIGVALSAMTGAAIWAQRRVSSAGRLTTVTGKASRLKPIPLGRWKWLAYILCFGFGFLALILPMTILIYTSVLKWFTANPFDGLYTIRNYAYIIESASTIRSFWNTLLVSGVGAAAGVLLGLMCAYFTLRLQPRGYRILDFFVSLPFGVPGIVLGLGLLWAYAYLPLPLYGTLALMIIAFVTRFLPYATETIGGQMVQIDKSLEEAAWVNGATPLEGVSKILLPLVRPSVQGAYFLLFMAFFREISSAILLYTASTAVVSISIWSFFEQANWGLASALSVVATLIIFVAMGLISRLVPAARQG